MRCISTVNRPYFDKKNLGFKTAQKRLLKAEVAEWLNKIVSRPSLVRYKDLLCTQH